jgi:hypothetical protein
MLSEPFVDIAITFVSAAIIFALIIIIKDKIKENKN